MLIFPYENWFNSGYSFGIGNPITLRLLRRILRLNFVCFLRKLYTFMIILLLLYNVLLLLHYLMKTLLVFIHMQMKTNFLMKR